MASVTFNTLKYANRLKQAGVSSEQAEAQSEALAEALQTHQSELATKADLVALKNELKNDIAAIRADMEKIALTLFIKLGSLMAGLVALLGGGLALLIRMQ